MICILWLYVFWCPGAPEIKPATEKEFKQIVVTTKGTTPVKNVPADYYPAGRGYWFVIQEGLDKGKKMFFRDSVHGTGTPVKTIVFVHGNPEASYIYRKTIQELIAKAKKPFRLVAMDHIGFGLSDQATYEMVCMDHARNLRQLIRHLDLKNVTFVIHDWGGPTGVGAFIKEPHRVSNLVITNTTVFPMPETGFTYTNYPISWLPWSSMPTVIPNRAFGYYASFAIFTEPSGAFSIIGGFIIHALKLQFGFYPEKERTAVKLFTEQFQSKTNVASSIRLIRQSAVWASGNKYEEPTLGTRDTGPFYRYIQDNIKKLWGPGGRNIGVRMVVGRWDPTGKDEVIKQWRENLPQLDGHVQTFENVCHFIEEVKYKEIADAIIDVSKL